MNTIAEAELDRLIEVLLEQFARDDRPALRAYLIRRLYGWRFAECAVKARVPPRQMIGLWYRGRSLLAAYIAAGRLDRDDLAEAFTEALYHHQRRQFRESYAPDVD